MTRKRLLTLLFRLWLIAMVVLIAWQWSAKT